MAETDPEIVPREIMTPEQLAQYLGLGRTFTYKLISSGETTSLKIGRLRRIRRVDVERWLERRVNRSDEGHQVCSEACEGP
jgi:excisionase family DNA binding protein